MKVFQIVKKIDMVKGNPNQRLLMAHISVTAFTLMLRVIFINDTVHFS